MTERIADSQHAGSSRVLTIPNLLSMLRLLGVPLFLWLLLGPKADGWALTVLIVSAFTDWADGKLARLLNQFSRLGELLDPAADRLYIVATLIAFAIRGIIPWWVAAVLIGRDLLLALCVPLLRRHGYPALPVHYLGKAATFCLLYAFPLLLLAQGDALIQQIALPFGGPVPSTSDRSAGCCEKPRCCPPGPTRPGPPVADDHPGRDRFGPARHPHRAVSGRGDRCLASAADTAIRSPGRMRPHRLTCGRIAHQERRDR